MESKYSCLKSVLENDSFQETKIKRKFRTSLTVKNKLEVIEYATLHPNATQSKIASHFGIDRTTVSKVLKRKSDILKYADMYNGSTDELMFTSLMKKGSLKEETIDSNDQIKKSVNNNASSSNNKHKLRQLLPKGGIIVDNSNTKSALSSKKSLKGLTQNYQDTVDVYHPELTGKCESWFMEQNLSPNKSKKGHEHIANIRSFSKLLSIIPLSDSECYKILAGKHVRDACMMFVSKLAGEITEAGRSIASRSYELLHRFLLEGMPELDLEQYYCNGFSAFEADDVKRIWVKYVQPKLNQLHNEDTTKLILPRSLPAESELTVSVTPEQAPDISDISLPQSPDDNPSEAYSDYIMQGEMVVVRGSRKRKMNSKPMKMIAVDSDSNSSYHIKDDDIHDDYVNYYASITKEENTKSVTQSSYSDIENTFAAQSPNENIAPENLVVPSKKRKSTGKGQSNRTKALPNGKNNSQRNDYPVIEIKPDGCSDDESCMTNGSSRVPTPVNGNKSTKPNKETLNSSVANTTHLILAYTKSLEERIHKMEAANFQSTKTNKATEKYLEATVADDISKLFSDSLNGIMHSFSEQVSQLAKSNISSTNCSCECTSLKDQVVKLEQKMDTLQGTMDKIYEVITSK